jgi:hypothetical protein
MAVKPPTVRTRADSISMFIEAHTPRFAAEVPSQVTEQRRRMDQDRNDPNMHRYLPPQATVSSFAPRIRLDENLPDSREETISNRKLGRNQQVLSHQIEELGAMLKEMRAELRLMQEGTSGSIDEE